MTSVVRKLMALSLALSALFAAPAYALDAGDIVVESVKGEVRITMNGAESRVRAGGVLELPATIDTGRDGAIELRQGATTVSVGPETRLEFPALEKRGDPVDRIVQPRGNVFYNIGKRAGRRLRVETPYLVGVIKGTQFNVASQPDSTTISLFEGALEIHASDDSSIIDLNAGEIASRKRGGTAISVIKMEGDKAPPAQRAPAAPAGGSGGAAAPGVSSPAHTTFADAVLVDRGASAGPAAGVETHGVSNAPNAESPVGAAVELRGNDGGVNLTPPIDANSVTTGVEAGAAVNVAAAVGADVDVGASAGAGAIHAGALAGIDTGPASVDVGANTNVNLGAAAIDVGANLSVDAGAIGADAGSAVNVNLGAGAVDVDVGANVAVDAGPLNVDTGAAAAVDVGAGNVAANVDVSAGVDVGNVAGVDTGAAASLDLGTSVEVAANVDVGANVGGVTAGVAAGVDVGAGSVDLGVNLGGVDLNVGVDLGLDDGNNGHGNDAGNNDNSNPGTGGGSTPSPTAPVVDVVGGLLDGILNRHRKK
jgi:hypothetical protein